MRTTLDLPENLLAEAMQLTNIPTKTKVIVAALEELIKKNKMLELTKYKGKVAMDIDLDTLRGRKCRY